MVERYGFKRAVNVFLSITWSATWSAGILLISQAALAASHGESVPETIEASREEEEVSYTTMTSPRGQQQSDRCGKKSLFLRVGSIQPGGSELPSEIHAEGPAGRRARAIASGLGC